MIINRARGLKDGGYVFYRHKDAAYIALSKLGDKISYTTESFPNIEAAEEFLRFAYDNLVVDDGDFTFFFGEYLHGRTDRDPLESNAFRKYSYKEEEVETDEYYLEEEEYG